MGYFQEQDQEDPLMKFLGVKPGEGFNKQPNQKGNLPQGPYLPGVDTSPPHQVLPKDSPYLPQEKPAAQVSPEAEYGKTLDSYIEDLGVQHDQFKQYITQAQDALNLKDSDLDKMDVDFNTGLRRGLAAFGPVGIEIANQVTRDLGGPETQSATVDEKGMPTKTPEDMRIEANRMKMRDLYGQLRDAPFMRTWFGILAYVLLAATTKSPSFAARIMMINPNREGTLAELQSLRDDIRMDQRKLDYDEQRKNQIRSWAAQQMASNEVRKQNMYGESYRVMMAANQKIQAANSKEESAGWSKLLRQYLVAENDAKGYLRTARNFGEVVDTKAEALYVEAMKKKRELSEKIQAHGLEQPNEP